MTERLAQFLTGLLGAILPDVIMIAGFASIVYGISLMSKPGAFIAGGAAAVLVALASSGKRA